MILEVTTSFSSQNVWNFTVTYSNRLYYTMVSARGLVTTPTQTVCRSTETAQKANPTIAPLQRPNPAPFEINQVFPKG